MEKQSARRGVSHLVLAVLLAPACLSAAGSAPPGSLTIGSLTLHRCATPAPWCATLERRLDPRGVVAGTVPIYFEYYPHTGAGAAAGTLVGAEGGPGYPSTDSRDSYLALFAPLRPRYDVVIMDYRGTGRSGAIDCRELQNAPALTEANIGACGRSLGATAPFYSTALASDDLAAILDALGAGRVGLYGNSYGSFFAQVFALRHRDKIRALVLDGADALDGPDVDWSPNYAPAMRAKFNLACARSPPCAALGGSSLEHIAPALERLRAQPFKATVRYGDDRTLTFTANATALAILMFAGSPDLASVRETDAAARAFVSGDTAPLLRLMAETLGSVDSRDATRNPAIFSAGLAAATTCLDATQIYDMYLPVPQRRVARDAAIAERQAHAPATYAPFTLAEFRAMPLDYAFIDQCVEWPPPTGYPPSPLVFAKSSFPDVPVLVVSGELDNMTPVADGTNVAAHFAHSRHVVIANSFHVNALPHARSECAAALVRRFMDTLATGDASCTAAVPPLRLVPRFARSAHELDAARASAGNQAGEEELRAVTAALLTVEDVIARAAENGAGGGLGLRGGSFRASATGAGYDITLQAVRWSEDLTISGRIAYGGRAGRVRGRIGVQGAPATGELEIGWREGVNDARAMIRGTLNGKAVVAQAPAP